MAAIYHAWICILCAFDVGAPWGSGAGSEHGGVCGCCGRTLKVGARREWHEFEGEVK